MRVYPELLRGSTAVAYRAKVKLHGTNAAVRCSEDGAVVAQSRSKDITPSDDNAGFAQWVSVGEVQSRFRRLCDRNIVVYGEWCGKGIQKGVAISQVDRIFAVFAARLLGTDTLIVEPSDLATLVQGIPGVHVIPWYGDMLFSVDWASDDATLTEVTTRINAVVSDVEREDPWVKETFGVIGTGEGIVMYPVSKEHLGVANFTNLTFKAKGEKHKNVSTAAPAQVNPEVAASVDAFVAMVVTEARLEQGATVASGGPATYDMKLMGKFMQWVVGDVEKETQDELDASGLTFKQVSKAVSDRARKWYIEKSRTT
jgi:hypothetical protein